MDSSSDLGRFLEMKNPEMKNHPGGITSHFLAKEYADWGAPNSHAAHGRVVITTQVSILFLGGTDRRSLVPTLESQSFANRQQ